MKYPQRGNHRVNNVRKGVFGALRTHGMTGTSTYRIWLQMMNRCKPNMLRSKYYGDRGIRVCRRWARFENFLKDMGIRPKHKSIERINNNMHYSPSNCKWATRYEQSRNRRDNIWITHNGETRCVVDWAKKIGIRCGTLSQRIRSGWSTKRALTESVK